MYGAAIHEIAVKAQAAEQAVGTKAKIRTIKEIAQKLDGLGYVEPKLAFISKEIMDVIGNISVNKKNNQFLTTEELAVGYVLGAIANEKRMFLSVEGKESLFRIPSIVENNDTDEVNVEVNVKNHSEERSTENTVLW